VKDTSAVCAEKAGARRPGQASPNGARTPVVAGTGHAEALTSAANVASAAAPGGVQAGRDALAALAGALAGVLVALVARCGASS
jgi:hypothetical protein